MAYPMKNQRNIPLVLDKYGEFLLKFKMTCTHKYLDTTLSFDQFSMGKMDLPLFDGTIRKGNREVAKMITIDVDSDEGEAKLRECMTAYNGSLPIFKSYSHSGKMKVHLIIDVLSGELKGNRFMADHKLFINPVKAAKMLATIIGLPLKYVDLMGVSRCFITESLYWAFQEVRESVTFSELQQQYDDFMAENVRREALAKLDASSTMAEVQLAKAEALAKKTGWAAKDEEWKASRERQLRGTISSATLFVENRLEQAKLAFPGLSEQALRCLLLYVAAAREGKAWLSSFIGITVLGERQFYGARKDLEQSGLLTVSAHYVIHKTSTVFALAAELTAFATKVRDKVVVFAGNMQDKLRQFLEAGGGAGSFNSLEVILCLMANSLGIGLDDVLAVLHTCSEWLDEERYRTQRVCRTFNWATRTVAKNQGEYYA